MRYNTIHYIYILTSKPKLNGSLHYKVNIFEFILIGIPADFGTVFDDRSAASNQ